MVGTAMAIDLPRLARSLYLDCAEVEPGVYRITGGELAHRVRLGAEPHCDCTDFAVRGGACKHILRVRLAQGDVGVLRTLQLLVPYPRVRTATPA